MDNTMSERQTKLEAARLARAAHVQAWRHSKLTQDAYCAANKINATTFSGWIASAGKNLKLPPRAAVSGVLSTLTAVPVVVRDGRRTKFTHTTNTLDTAEVRDNKSAATQGPEIQIKLTAHNTGWQLDIAGVNDPRWLAALVGALGARNTQRL